ncbi:iron-sulfur cluster repair di-iron protein [Alloacidobacterium sp.]|uniref:iron-sulfur cluster repair di-iron protein n=1 Tax=Alloacidobacterium sp. TaxID=2951999 RepID=UPI002D24FC02|nr:iron-sulfur cluster repair di-iron protein [Alloacidobacterium sp.]HYK37518.1 iron-sulfur cluster repair di-iron protein [Alloacidobacterium sp.]
MMIITAETPVRDIAVEAPDAIPVLEQFGIDYCCGGKYTLAEACAGRDQNVAIVIEELECRGQNMDQPENAWQTAPLPDLIDYIVGKHHAFTRDQLGLVLQLAAKVERRHGAEYPEIYKVNEKLMVISAELTHHFFCEENVLFPYIKQLSWNQKPLAQAVFGSVQQPVTRMMMDHNQTGDELRMLREVTNNFLPPDSACTTLHALYRALEDLERDLHQHIHLENNILFPRALKLESERA